MERDKITEKKAEERANAVQGISLILIYRMLDLQIDNAKQAAEYQEQMEAKEEEEEEEGELTRQKQAEKQVEKEEQNQEMKSKK